MPRPVPCSFPTFKLAASLLLLGVLNAEARIGDSPEQMSSRILQPDVGRAFSWPKEMKERDRELAIKELPILQQVHLLPTASEGWREQIFWKSALRRQLSNEDGWRVHVFYFNGVSAVECYKRVGGGGLSEFEINGLLARVRGNLVWRKVAKVEGAPSIEMLAKQAAQNGGHGSAAEPKEKEKRDTVLGYEFELGEEGQEALRAYRKGDWFVVYSKRFDDYLVSRWNTWMADEHRRLSELRAQQEQTAPASVEGF